MFAKDLGVRGGKEGKRKVSKWSYRGWSFDSALFSGCSVNIVSKSISLVWESGVGGHTQRCFSG